ncbi:MAG: D-amino-acid transaminase [Erysipelotrichaceae bacterium]
MKYLWKGKIVNKNEMDIDVNDRGYVFGDGIYEFVRVYNGKLFALEEHLDRFENSAKLLEMNLNYSRDEIRQFFYDLIDANDLKEGNVYIQFTRGDGAVRNHNYLPYEQQKSVVSGNVSSYGRDVDKIENGVSAILYPDKRWLMCNAKSLNLLPNCMAIAEAKRRGANKAILYRDSYITEERAGNVLIVKNGEVFSTPDSPEILPGITKLLALQFCRELHIPYEERKFTINELLEADEVIVTDSKTECCPIIKIEDKVIGNGRRGPISTKLDDAYKELIFKQCGVNV